MTAPAAQQRQAVPLTPPAAQCDVVMQGGITSGVVYPRALAEFATTYRLRNLGGSSAGAIGAALGAAAEFGRASGGFDRLAAVPGQLGDGRLAALFQPQPETRPLLPLLLALTGHDRHGTGRRGVSRVLAGARAAAAGFPVASLAGVLPGLALVVWGATRPDIASLVVLVVVGVVLAVTGWVAAILVRLATTLGHALPANLFGICRGLAVPPSDGSRPSSPGFTDWLSAQLDDLAGLNDAARPLRFGQLWSGTTRAAYARRRDRVVDLRMIGTCVTLNRPFEMPWDARTFFYSPAVWRTLFPGYVVDALEAAPTAQPEDKSARGQWQWEDEAATAQGLRRLPAAEHLPVIVATRLSLSFPLLISAVPLFIIDRRSPANQELTSAYRAAARAGEALPQGPAFTQVWFTDGGLCSNFPLHLFDAALPTRPTFAINLGPFPEGDSPSADQTLNIDYATHNLAGILPRLVTIPERGLAAVAGFASAAFATARNWSDETQLYQPGYRDRVVRVLQSRDEGGLNLSMSSATIEALAERGRVAARAMIDQFTQPRYPVRQPRLTGWDNHRWIRYRALLAALPDWLRSYGDGRSHDDLAKNPPSYRLSGGAKALAEQLSHALDNAAGVVTPEPDWPDRVAAAHEKALKDLAAEPAPPGVIRRTPVI